MVKDIIQEEFENWKEDPQDVLIQIYSGSKLLISAWIEDCINEMSEYMDIKYEHVDYYTEVVEIYI